ncbi:MAG: DedA family protein [Geminicoccaceae bacterium]
MSEPSRGLRVDLSCLILAILLGWSLVAGVRTAGAADTVAVPATGTFAAWAKGRIEALIDDADPILQRWGYPAVAAVTALDTLGIPTPGASMMVAATVGALRHDLNLSLVALLAFAGAMVGSQAGFAVGRYGGRALLARLPVAPERVASVERTYARWGAWVVLVAPFLDGLRQLSSFAAGLLELPWWKFTVVNLVANTLWVTVWVGGTWLVREDEAELLHLFHELWPVLVVAAALAILALLVRRRRRSNTAKAV